MKNENKQNFIEQTKQEFQPYYENPLTDVDAQEIINNFSCFMGLLIKWDKEKQKNNVTKIEEKKQNG